jgi:hypothetical protein
MAATLTDIEAAIWTALAGLVAGYTVDSATPTTPSIAGTSAPSDAHPVRSLQRYAGEVTLAFAELAEKGLGMFDATQLPAVFVAFAGAKPLGADGAYVEGGGHLFEAVLRTRWAVYVVVGDVRGDAQATLASIAGQPAALSISQKVLETLTGLQIAGLHDGKPLELDGLEPWIIARRIAFIYAANFHADMALPGESVATPETAPGARLHGVTMHVNDAAPDTDDATVTLSGSTFSID